MSFLGNLKSKLGALEMGVGVAVATAVGTASSFASTFDGTALATAADNTGNITVVVDSVKSIVATVLVLSGLILTKYFGKKIIGIVTNLIKH